MNPTPRIFDITQAVREQTPLIVAFIGPSGSGKTASSLELSHGFQDVQGGDIGVADTEGRRSLAYAGFPCLSDPKRSYKFQFLDFKPPFAPLDFIAAGEQLIKKGCKHIIYDSMSLMWEGKGGVLAMHDEEMERMIKRAEEKGWKSKGQDSYSFPAWKKAKGQQQEFINWMKQQPVNFSFCFRAKQKLKLLKEGVVPIGWQAITDDDLIFEMSLACLLLPDSDGQPIWNKKEEPGVKALHAQFRPVFENNPRCSIALGRKLAEWGKGGSTPQALPAVKAQATPAPVGAPSAPAAAPAKPPMSALALKIETAFLTAKTEAYLNEKMEKFNEVKGELTVEERKYLLSVRDMALEEILKQGRLA